MIWLDGDACPKQIREILYRAAIRTMTTLVVVSNHYYPLPASPFIKRRQVATGFDVADNYIVTNLNPGDLVITADIPLADLAISKDATVINPRGELYTKQNIKQQLTNRNMNEQLRSSGLIHGGPPKLGSSEIQRFANHLDKYLAK